MFGNDCCCLRRFAPQLQAHAVRPERENYRNLIELGISAEDVKRVMGEDVYCEMMMTCVGGGLAKEMGREDLFDCTQKMDLF